MLVLVLPPAHLVSRVAGTAEAAVAVLAGGVDAAVGQGVCREPAVCRCVISAVCRCRCVKYQRSTLQQLPRVCTLVDIYAESVDTLAHTLVPTAARHSYQECRF